MFFGSLPQTTGAAFRPSDFILSTLSKLLKDATERAGFERLYDAQPTQDIGHGPLLLTAPLRSVLAS